MNIYFGTFFAILIAVACAGSAWEGHSIGVNSQKAEDQKQFDTINANITKQKAQAAADLLQSAKDNVLLANQRDQLAATLGAQHAQNVQLTNDNRSLLADAGRLRFAGQASGSGSGGQSAATGSAATAGNANPAACVLSDAASQSLKQIVFDADTLRDDYKLLYDWAHAVR